MIYECFLIGLGEFLGVQRDPAFKKVNFSFQTNPLSYIMRLPPE